MTEAKEDFCKDQEFTGRDTDGKQMFRKIIKVTDKHVYYNVKTGKTGEWQGAYVLDKKHMRQFVEQYCD